MTPGHLLSVNITTRTYATVALSSSMLPVNAIDVIPTSGKIVLLSMQPAPSKLGSYINKVFLVNPATGEGQLVLTMDPEDTYVNFQWSEVDPVTGEYRLLLGNENDADGLSVRLVTVDVTQGRITQVSSPSNTQFTIASIQSIGSDLLALSPGLVHDKATQWNVVSVDPVSGMIHAAQNSDCNRELTFHVTLD